MVRKCTIGKTSKEKATKNVKPPVRALVMHSALSSNQSGYAL